MHGRVSHAWEGESHGASFPTISRRTQDKNSKPAQDLQRAPELGRSEQSLVRLGPDGGVPDRLGLGKHPDQVAAGELGDVVLGEREGLD